MFSAFFYLFLAASPPNPVLAVSPVRAPGFPAGVTVPLSTKLVELARDSGRFSVFDQKDLRTVLLLQKENSSPVIADPVTLGRMVAARKVLTADLRRTEAQCSLGLKITDVETGLVEAAKLEVTDCALARLFETAERMWESLLVGKLQVVTAPPGLSVSIDNGPARATPLELELPAGLHSVRVSAKGYASTLTSVAVPYHGLKQVRLASGLQPSGVLRLFGAPISASVFLGEEKLGHLPLSAEIEAGAHTLWVETDVGRYPAVVSVTPHQTVRQAVWLPFEELANFERAFVAANQAALEKRYWEAIRHIESAIGLGLAAMGRVDPSARDELRAALSYSEGVRALQRAWVLRAEAESLGKLGAYCDALLEASRSFESARRTAPTDSVLGLSAVRLARVRKSLTLGACSAERRFDDRVDELVWPVSATAQTIVYQARLNRALLGELRAQSGLSAMQRQWLLAETALMEGFDRWATMVGLQGGLLRSPAETLPRFCGLKREALMYTLTAKSRYQGVREAELPLRRRMETVSRLEERIRSRGSLCAE